MVYLKCKTRVPPLLTSPISFKKVLQVVVPLCDSKVSSQFLARIKVQSSLAQSAPRLAINCQIIATPSMDLQTDGIQRPLILASKIKFRIKVFLTRETQAEVPP